MADTPQPAAVATAVAAPRPTRDLVMVTLAAIVPSSLLFGAVRDVGGRNQVVTDHERRIAVLEGRAGAVEEINQRLARIEGRLEITPPRRPAAD